MSIVFLSAVFCFGASAGAVSNATFQDWGRQSLAEIKADYSHSTRNLFTKSPTDGSPAYAWAQGVLMGALAAACESDRTYIDETRAFFDDLQTYFWCTYNGTSGYNASYRSCGDRYYDDNAWMALGLIEFYKVCGDEKYLERAKATVAFSMSGENGPEDDPPGGIRWHESRTGGSSVCAGAPTALANLMLYELTGIEQYFEDGLRVYTWLATCGLHRYSSGIYHEVGEGPLGYQTAVVTQCAVHLYKITGDLAYLAEAQRLGAAMEHEFIDRDTHRLKQTGKWGGHDMTNAYADLYEADGNPHWLNLAAGYIEFLRDNGWDPVTGRYPTSWNSTTIAPSDDLLDQASACRALWRMSAVSGGSAPVYLNVVNRTSNRCLRPFNSQKADDTSVVIYDVLSSYVSEYWTLTDLQNGFYGIRSGHSDTSLKVYKNQTFNNAPVVIYATDAAQRSQQWSLTDVGGSWYNIQSRLSGKSLQPQNAQTGNNVSVVVAATNTGGAQQWKFPGLAVPTSITPAVSVNGGPWTQTDRVLYNFGDSVAYRGEAAGQGTWSWSGPNGFTSSGSQFTGTSANPSHAGTYCVTFTNGSGVESYSSITAIPVTGVSLFQNINYTGWAAKFGPGAYRAAHLTAIGAKANDASSIRVEPGYKVTFYDNDNFTGATLVKTADDASLVDDGWNDRAGSMIVEEIDTPIAHWPMNGSLNPTVTDISPNGFDGHCVNMTIDAWTAGKHCRGLSFDGVDDFVDVEQFKGIAGGGSRTCMAWIKTTGKNGGIITWGHELPGEKWNFGIDGWGGLGLEVGDGYICSTTPVIDGTWHHVAAVLENDGTPDVGEVKLYVDGVPETPSVILPQTINSSAYGEVTLGSFAGGTNFFFQGVLDEVRVYARALSDAEIRSIYEADALTADIHTDGRVNLADLAALSEAWQSAYAGAADLTCDGQVDMDDLLILIDEWLDAL